MIVSATPHAFLAICLGVVCMWWSNHEATVMVRSVAKRILRSLNHEAVVLLTRESRAFYYATQASSTPLNHQGTRRTDPMKLAPKHATLMGVHERSSDSSIVGDAARIEAKHVC